MGVTVPRQVDPVYTRKLVENEPGSEPVGSIPSQFLPQFLPLLSSVIDFKLEV